MYATSCSLSLYFFFLLRTHCASCTMHPRITWLSNGLLFGLVRVNASPAEWPRVMSLQMQVETWSSKNEWKFFRWAGESIKCNGSRIHVFLKHFSGIFLFTRIDSERVNDMTSLRDTRGRGVFVWPFFYIHRLEPGTDDAISNQVDGQNAHRRWIMPAGDAENKIDFSRWEFLACLHLVVLFHASSLCFRLKFGWNLPPELLQKNVNQNHKWWISKASVFLFLFRIRH